MAEGYYDFVAGTGLPAANLEDFCERQAIMRFASAAARDAALVLIKTEGMFAYCKDVHILYMYNSAGAWEIVYEPKQAWALTTISQGVPVAVTTSRGWYQRCAGVWHAHISLAITSTGTLGSGVLVALPFPLQNVEDVGGTFAYGDTGTATYAGVVIPNTTSGCTFAVHNSASGLGAVPSFAMANTDTFRIDLQGTY